MVRVGILDGEAADRMRRAHGELQPDRRTEIVQVDEAFLDGEPQEQLVDAVGEGRERRLGQGIRGAEARQVGCHDKCRLGQRLDHVAEGTRELGKPCSSTSALRLVSPADRKARSIPQDRRMFRMAGFPGMLALPGKWRATPASRVCYGSKRADSPLASISLTAFLSNETKTSAPSQLPS